MQHGDTTHWTSPGGVAQLVERVLYHSTRRAVPERSWVQSLLPTTEVEPGFSTFGGMLVPVLQLISPVCKTGTSLDTTHWRRMRNGARSARGLASCAAHMPDFCIYFVVSTTSLFHWQFCAGFLSFPNSCQAIPSSGPGSGIYFATPICSHPRGHGEFDAKPNGRAQISRKVNTRTWSKLVGEQHHCAQPATRKL
jgi:hypothetical protein